MKFDDLTCCPFCGHGEYYEMQRIAGAVCFRMRYDGNEADNSEMYNDTNTTGSGRVYCSNCYKYIGNTKTGAIGKKAAERLKKRGEK